MARTFVAWMSRSFIGDPLTLAAGIMRERFIVFLALVAFAKTARYVVLALAVMP
jgi:membrane protein YqaA with SNARE-associated domain